jgi:1-deoxy-D-xylulose-5-phosphate reductoisomerase
MIVLGSTGSIGINVLQIASKYNLTIDILCAGYNYKLLNKQIKQFKPRVVIVANKEVASKVIHNNIYYSQKAIIEQIHISKSKLVVNALVGFFGLLPTIESIKSGKKVALANKESLVVAGKFIDIKNIVPIDSEHFALSYIINKTKKIHKMTITASGGALRDFNIEDIANASVKDVLAHPNWDMGNKITVDSASMCNKLFELMEAKWLFDINNLDAIIEPSSHMHAFIEYSDGSIVSHIASTDMKLPIAYALLGEMDDLHLPRVDLLSLGTMKFVKIDESKYPMWNFKNDILNNLDLGVVLNRANEESVYKFLDNKIKFNDIYLLTKKALEKFKDISLSNIDDVFEIDAEVKKYMSSIL